MKIYISLFCRNSCI